MVGSIGVPLRERAMSAQKGELKKNFIAILSDIGEEQRAVESLAASDRPVKDYVLGLIAVVRSLRRIAR
jgi:hypothetical protein